MTLKRTNLCLSADVHTTSELLDLASELGPHIVILKTHIDILRDFSERTITSLTTLSKKHKFLLFEDRKFGDIGHTVQSQYAAGTFKIANWAYLVNAHAFPGEGVVEGLKAAAGQALASEKSVVRTEISGGGEVSEELVSYMAEEKQRRRQSGLPPLLGADSDTDSGAEAESSSGLGESAVSERGREPTPRGAKLSNEHRKGSVVSVSTTISSSAEYISPPSTATGSRFRSVETPSPTPSGRTVLPVAGDPEAGPPFARGLLLVAQMSSKNNLLTSGYTDACYDMATRHRDFVVGFIAQEGLNRREGDNFLTMTPGIQLPPADGKGDSKGDTLGQQYNTPRHAVLGKGVDVIIVGRGILNATDRVAEAKRYREEGWLAYLERVGAAEA